MRSYKPEEVKELFSNYIGEPISFKIDNKEYKLNMYVADLAKITSATGGGEAVTEEGVRKIGEALLHMFYRTYLPYWNEVIDAEVAELSEVQKAEQESLKAQLQNFIIKNYNAIFTAVAKNLGWITDTDKKKIEDNVKKLKSLGSQPQQSKAQPSAE